jgi:hypothetical protein
MAGAHQPWASPLGSGWQQWWQQRSPALVMQAQQQVAGPEHQVLMWEGSKAALQEHGAGLLQAGLGRLHQSVQTTRCWVGRL